MMPETTTERAALIGFYLGLGVALTTKEVARLTGLQRVSAWELMTNISRVVPIYQDDNQIWRICSVCSE